MRDGRTEFTRDEEVTGLYIRLLYTSVLLILLWSQIIVTSQHNRIENLEVPAEPTPIIVTLCMFFLTWYDVMYTLRKCNVERHYQGLWWLHYYWLWSKCNTKAMKWSSVYKNYLGLPPAVFACLNWRPVRVSSMLRTAIEQYRLFSERWNNRTFLNLDLEMYLRRNC